MRNSSAEAVQLVILAQNTNPLGGMHLSPMHLDRPKLEIAALSAGFNSGTFPLPMITAGTQNE